MLIWLMVMLHVIDVVLKNYSNHSPQFVIYQPYPGAIARFGVSTKVTRLRSHN